VAKRGRKKGSPLEKTLILVMGFALGFVAAVLVLRYLPNMGPAPTPPPPSIEKGPPPEARGPVPAPRVAIVIDDMGGSLRKIREILDLDAPITIAVLPHLRHSREVSRLAGRSGREVLLHLPMEPRNILRNHPGPGVLLTSMTGPDLRKTMEEDLDFVPEAVGVNNHMGSKFTADTAGMREVFSVLRERGLFFVDSRTTSHTLGTRLAREAGVPRAERDVFLDNRRDATYIDGQIETLVRIAGKTGSAIAIGHPYPETLAALRRALPGLRERGIEVVPVSDLTRGDKNP